MKKMNLKSAIAIVSLMFGMFMFQSCTDECKDVTCLNGGVCDEATGDCICATGYEGVDCATLMNAKFIGSYNVTDGCTNTPYSLIVSAESEANKISFSNLGNFSTPAVIKATVDGTTITITNYIDSSQRKFNGTGSINTSSGTISLTYTVLYSDNTTETCTTSMVK
jgi:hypothetical protein